MSSEIELVPVSRGNTYYKHFRRRHYVPDHGQIGRQIHYLIIRDMVPIGIITGASAVWAVKTRDEFFGITKENREEMINKIINNTVFRLEVREKNLGSRVLAMWRRAVVDDWEDRYRDDVIGFETFVYGRQGTVYKADNWTYVGMTKGSAKVKPHGAYRKGERRETVRKLIFCKRR